MAVLQAPRCRVRTVPATRGEYGMLLLVPILVFAALPAAPARAGRLAGIEVPETLASGGNRLILNGAGVRTRFFVDVYVGALYLKARSADAAAILDADDPMAVKLWIVTDRITAERLKESIEAGFERANAGNTASMRTKIDALTGAFGDEVRAGDVFEMVYAPGEGLTVHRNGFATAAIQSGLAFKRAFFGIWISERPVQASLKRGMLGGPP